MFHALPTTSFGGFGASGAEVSLRSVAPPLILIILLFLLYKSGGATERSETSVGSACKHAMINVKIA